MYADAQSTAGCTPPGCTPPKNFGGMFKSTDGGAKWSNITARRELRRAARRLPVRLRPDDRRRPRRREQGLRRLPGAVVLVGRRRQLQQHQRQRHPLGSPRARLQPARSPRERRRHDAGLDRDRRWQPLHRRRRPELRPAERRDRDEPLPRDGHRPRRGQQRLQLRRRAGHRDDAHKPGDSGTEWHESVDADGGPMAVDWQDPDNAFGISNGQFIRTTNGGDSWNRPGSGDISCMPMSAAAAVDPNDGQHVYVPTNNGTLNSDGSACSQSQGSVGIFRSMDGGGSFAGTNFVATPATPRSSRRRRRTRTSSGSRCPTARSPSARTSRRRRRRSRRRR